MCCWHNTGTFVAAGWPNSDKECCQMSIPITSDAQMCKYNQQCALAGFPYKSIVTKRSSHSYIQPLGIQAYPWLNSSLPSAAYKSVNWVNIGSDNGLTPVWHQAITWTNDDLLSFGPLRTNFSEIRIKIQIFHSWKCIPKSCLRNSSHFVPGGMS